MKKPSERFRYTSVPKAFARPLEEDAAGDHSQQFIVILYQNSRQRGLVDEDIKGMLAIVIGVEGDGVAGEYPPGWHRDRGG